jgi:hypothetical protein
MNKVEGMGMGIDPRVLVMYSYPGLAGFLPPIFFNNPSFVSLRLVLWLQPAYRETC